MKVTFIYHSSYFVELDHCCLLFDYYQGDIPQVGKPLYVFASHSHPDHFSPAIFQLAGEEREVHYLLSDDISPRQVPEKLRDQATFVGPRSFCQVGPLKVATLRSTDMGVAFLVQCEGKCIYHAGDLNCWVWDGAPRFQNDQMRQLYQQELELLRDKDIDVAFVPLDPRQEADFDLGMKYFFEAGGAQHVFPMHMWGDYSVVPLFKSTPTYREYAKHVMDVSQPGQSFEVYARQGFSGDKKAPGAFHLPALVFSVFPLTACGGGCTSRPGPAWPGLALGPGGALPPGGVPRRAEVGRIPPREGSAGAPLAACGTAVPRPGPWGASPRRRS